MIEMISAASSAHQKPSTNRPQSVKLVSQLVSSSMRALTTRVNRPSVMIVSGSADRLTIGLTMRLTSVKTKPTTPTTSTWSQPSLSVSETPLRKSEVSQMATALTTSRMRNRMAESCHADPGAGGGTITLRSEEHTSELQSRGPLVCRLLLAKQKNINQTT